jgi:hypothetical protein
LWACSCGCRITAYLFAVTGGAEELMSVGKTIAAGTFLDR